MKPSYDNKIGKIIYNDIEIPLVSGGGGSVAGAIIRTAELANIDITLSKDGTAIETKNTGTGGEVDFNVSEVGTYTLSTSTWSKDVVVEELNTIVNVCADTIENYTWLQIHEACQLGVAHLMWKPKDQKTYIDETSIYHNLKIMIADIVHNEDGTDKIKWCLANQLPTTYAINPSVRYYNGSGSWVTGASALGGMKHSTIELNFKVQGDEIYSQATGLLPDDVDSATIGGGVRLSDLQYTQSGAPCKVYNYSYSSNAFTETTNVIMPNAGTIESGCKFIKGYFKSVGEIDEATFNGGYYYTYSSGVYTRYPIYVSGTTYYGLYETIQEDGVFIAGLSMIRPYLVKEERRASTGGNKPNKSFNSIFSDYANIPAVEEITGLNREMVLSSGIALSGNTHPASIYNNSGEGEKQPGFDFSTQITGTQYLTRSMGWQYGNYWVTITKTGYIANTSVGNSYGVRVCFTTN